MVYDLPYLEPFNGIKSRSDCPQCGGRKKFTLYINPTTNGYYSPLVGRCERLNSCGYHYPPREFIRDNPDFILTSVNSGAKFLASASKSNVIHASDQAISFIPGKCFKESLSNYDKNNFAFFLKNKFGIKEAERVISKYFIGTSDQVFKRRDFPDYRSSGGASIFWQVDISGKIRTGKIMLYSIDGKRVKKPFSHILWAHTSLSEKEYSLKQCLFGEHLLRNSPRKVIGLVESEKTAIIASIYMPDFIWLACGGLSMLNAERCSILRGRRVVLFPDLKGYELWQNKARELSSIATFTVSDLLERKATSLQKMAGLDLADFLLQNESIIPDRTGLILRECAKLLYETSIANGNLYTTNLIVEHKLRSAGIEMSQIVKAVTDYEISIKNKRYLQ